MLEGGIEGRPGNVLFYATSNRRHLMPRQMIDNERSTAIHPGEAVEEKVSLSDRFGLWLGFHPCSQDTYLAMVDRYAEHFGLAVAARGAAARGAGVGEDPRQPLGPGSMAADPGRGRPARDADRRLPGARGLTDAGHLRARRVEQLDRVERLLAVAQLEVQLRRADIAGAADPGDPLAALDHARPTAPAAPDCGRRRW